MFPEAITLCISRSLKVCPSESGHPCHIASTALVLVAVTLPLRFFFSYSCFTGLGQDKRDSAIIQVLLEDEDEEGEEGEEGEFKWGVFKNRAEATKRFRALARSIPHKTRHQQWLKTQRAEVKRRKANLVPKGVYKEVMGMIDFGTIYDSRGPLTFPDSLTHTPAKN